jgi:carboxyl-terminal processing protease
MSDPTPPPTTPGGAPPPPAQHDPAASWWVATVPPFDLGGAAQPAPRSRTPLYVALFVVAALSGAALFVSGYTLGFQQSITPGTSAQNQQLFEPYWEAWNKITTEYVGDYDAQALVEGSLKGLFEALDDPYSGYMTSEEYKSSLSSISGDFEGIGAELVAVDADGVACTPISETCRLTVMHVLRKSPALEAGLMDGDVLLTVDGESVLGKTVETVVLEVRGPPDTTVVLGLERAGAPLEMSIVRALIHAEDVHASVIADGQIGYIQIEGFSSASADDFVDKLKTLVVEQEVRRIILDLRDDPGGFVDKAHTVASQFIAEGPVFWEEKADGTLLSRDAAAGGVATDPAIRLVVLVNGGSASASEIVAAALQDTGRATLVGETTFGKGTGQQWFLLNDGEAGGIRLSVFKWLTPSKTWIHGTGVVPDVVVPVPEGTPVDEDPQLERAVEILTSATGESTGPARAA